MSGLRLAASMGRGALCPLAVAAALPASKFGHAAAADLHTCDFKLKANNLKWLPDKVYVRHDTAAGTVEVIDAIISSYHDNRPIAGEIETGNTKRITFAWRVRDTRSNTNRAASFLCRMTFLKASRQATINGAPLNYARRFSSEGTCKVEKV
jgi:hypothetical protein